MATLADIVIAHKLKGHFGYKFFDRKVDTMDRYYRLSDEFQSDLKRTKIGDKLTFGRLRQEFEFHPFTREEALEFVNARHLDSLVRSGLAYTF